uniref:Uncharacterized protein n=1 Tax=Cyanoderma ruficeps TaxID=181631 RepID=A0A8C3R602_9PASS
LCIICAVKAFFIHVVNRDVGEIVNNFEGFSGELTSNRQLCCKTRFRWIGPEKGTVHLAVAAVLKALWAKQEGKQAAKHFWNFKQKMLECGYLAYSGSCSWLGYSDQLLKQYAYMFEVKVPAYLQDDIYRLRSIQQMIGQTKYLKKWEIEEAIEWVTEPTEFKHSCLNFPFSPLHCHNRLIFKHLLQAKALSCLQIDSCGLESVNETLSVLLMAKKFQRKALQNAYGFGGLCQLVQHLIVFDHIQVPETLENRHFTGASHYGDKLTKSGSLDLILMADQMDVCLKNSAVLSLLTLHLPLSEN